MEEQTISFKTSKLLKNKNFNEKVDFQFDKTGYKNRSCYDIEVVIGPYDKKEFTKVNHYPAPTQSLLQKWLREVHNIHITLFPEDKDDKTKIWISKLYTLNYGEDSEVSYLKQGGTKITYEEALEVGLQEGLKLIKK